MKSLRIVLLRSNAVAPDPAVEKVADALLSAGHSITILGWNRLGDPEENVKVTSGEIPAVRFNIPAKFGSGFKSFAPLFKFQLSLLKWLKKHKNEYDAIHAFDFDTGLVAKYIAKKYNKKLVYHILDFYIDSHGLANNKLGKFIKKIEFGVINFADVCIICSEKRAEQIKGSFPKKLVVIHNTPQYNLCEPDDSLKIQGNREKCRIVYVGILAGSRFIKQMADIVSKDERFEFHIGGFGNMAKSLEEYSHKFNNIFFVLYWLIVFF